MATYDTYNPYSRMSSMHGYPGMGIPGSTGPVGSHPVSMSTMVSKAGIPYAVNGVSLNGPQMELMHNAIGYPGKKTRRFF